MAKQRDDYEDRFFKLLNNRFDRLEDQQDEQNKILNRIHDEAKATNGRVTKLEEQMKGITLTPEIPKSNTSALPPWYRDRAIQLIVAGIVFIVLLAVASAVGFDVNKLPWIGQ